MREVIVFDPAKIKTEDVIYVMNREPERFSAIRAFPGTINPPIFILGKRPKWWRRIVAKIGDTKCL